MNSSISRGIERTNRIADMSLRKAALVAGLGYLVVFILTPSFWVESLFVPADAAATASNILASELLFRMGIASWLIVLVFDAVVAWAIYYLLEPVNRSLSLLAAWFRLVYVAIFGFNMLNWLNALQIIGGANDFTVFETGQRQAQMMQFFDAYGYGTNIAFVFFGIHIAILGYLVFKSDFIPQIIGGLLMVASVGYLIDSFASFLSFNYANNDAAFVLIVAVPAVIAELSLTLWLLIRGRKSSLPRMIT